jgi:YHS domain-containing protein
MENKEKDKMKKVIVAAVMLSAFLAAPPLAALAEHTIGHEMHRPDTKSGIFKDPVCGMDVTIKGAKYMCEYKKNKYYFCSDEDMQKFKKNPGKYLNKKNNQ